MVQDNAGQGKDSGAVAAGARGSRQVQSPPSAPSATPLGMDHGAGTQTQGPGAGAETLEGAGTRCLPGLRCSGLQGLENSDDFFHWRLHTKPCKLGGWVVILLLLAWTEDSSVNSFIPDHFLDY